MAHQPVSVAIEASGRAFQLYVSVSSYTLPFVAVEMRAYLLAHALNHWSGTGQKMVRIIAWWGTHVGRKTDTLGWCAMWLIGSYTSKCGITMQFPYPTKDGGNASKSRREYGTKCRRGEEAAFNHLLFTALTQLKKQKSTSCKPANIVCPASVLKCLVGLPTLISITLFYLGLYLAR